MNPPVYQPGIDGLRALAIASVVAFHAFPEWFPGGYIGVDVFFVISGYLITRILLRGLAESSFSFAGFYARRIRRILPALVLVLACTYALGRLILTPEEFRQLSKHAMAGAAFVSNFLLWHEAGYFDAAADFKPFLHLWSLAIEEQFYLAWPLLLYLAWKRRVNVVVVVAVIGCASFVWNVHSVINDPDGAFYGPASRFWELMIGCWLAAAQSKAVRPLEGARAETEAAVGLLLIVLGWCLLSRESAFPGGWALLPTVGTALLLQSGPGTWVNRMIFCRPWMVKLGLISYALYLWHWPLLAYLNVLNPEGAPVGARLAAIALAVVLAWMTHAVIERRIRWHPGRQTAPILLGLSALTLMVAFAGYARDLSPDRQLEARLEAARAWRPGYEADEHCKKRLSAAYCSIGQPQAAPTHALIGDSHANHFFPGLALQAEKSGGNLIHVGAAGCAPLSGLSTSDSPHCRATIDKALEYVLAEASIHTVVLAANWHPYARGSRFSAYRNRQAPRLELSGADGLAGSNPELFATALSRTVETLVKGGKSVVIIKQVPELAIRFETCLEKLRVAAGGAWSDRDCAVARRKVDAYVGGYTALLDAAVSGRPGVIVVDPLEALCDKDYCRAVVDSELLYRDDVHLGVKGSLYIAEKFWPAIAAAGRSAGM